MKLTLILLFAVALCSCTPEDAAKWNQLARESNASLQQTATILNNQNPTDYYQPYQPAAPPPPSENPMLTVWRLRGQMFQASQYVENGQLKTDFVNFSYRLSTVNATACPNDFQDAWRNYVRAESQFSSHYNFMSGIAGAFDMAHGNPREITRLNDEQAMVQNCEVECQRIMSQYGIAFN
jgi:hypothetical protein